LYVRQSRAKSSLTEGGENARETGRGGE
jgi:hypothetical protein